MQFVLVLNIYIGGTLLIQQPNAHTTVLSVQIWPVIFATNVMRNDISGACVSAVLTMLIMLWIIHNHSQNLMCDSQRNAGLQDTHTYTLRKGGKKLFEDKQH